MRTAQHATADAPVLEPEDRARAGIYRLLGAHLSKPLTQNELDAGARLLGDTTSLGQAIDRYAAACRSTTAPKAAEDYQTLFIGLGRGELVPYASYYLTGFLQEKPLARLRSDMNRLGLARTDQSSEPEDHAASVLEMMAGLVDGTFGPQLALDAQKLFYDAHIGSWMGHFFRDLEGSGTSPLYAALGSVGARFLAVEEEAFRMS